MALAKKKDAGVLSLYQDRVVFIGQLKHLALLLKHLALLLD